MAFEAFLAAGDPRPRRRRRLTYAVSLAVHAALLSGGVAYSFWHVEEITPPRVHVTFMAAAPPPPAPPPPPAGGAASEAPKKKTPPKVKPTLTALVQPQLVPPKKEEPQQGPDDDDPDQAFAGGAKGGTPGGTIGGTIGGKIGGTIGGAVGGVVGGAPQPTKPRLLPPQMGAKRRISGDDPEFPAIYRRSGLVYVVLAQVCVSKTGSVDSVTILHGANSTLDENVVKAIQRTWRYDPMLANNIPVPFCYPARVEFNSN